MPRRAAAATADDGDRRGDDQSAGAGDHQQYQGLVDPVKPCAAEGERRHDGNQHGHREHRRRVDAGELVDEALRGRTAALRGLHGMDDARERRVAGACGHLVFERAGLIDGSGEDLVTFGLLDGQALAGDGRLVDGRSTRVIRPSSAMRSPGRTRTTAPFATSLAGSSVHEPSACRTVAVSGAKSISPEWRCGRGPATSPRSLPPTRTGT